MQTAAKVVLNTAVLYAKILVSMAIALISVPFVLNALGASDYGLYNLIAGVVSMLAFLNNAMTVSSQRYMSVAMGGGDNEKINKIFNVSFIMHLNFAVIIAITLEIIGMLSINRLNIEPDRVWCAHLIFQFLVVNLFSKIIAVPFDAIMNAHEDMIAFSVIELIDSGLMLTIAITLQYIHIDKLAFYGLCIALIAIFTLLMKYVWCRTTYKRYRITLKSIKDKVLLKEMTGFAGWNLLGGLALMGRNQGVAIVFNLFLGTLANAAYGLANQISGALTQFSSTFQRAINPQLMKSEGMLNRNRLHKITYITSKFSIIALSFFAIPLLIEMEDVIKIWLHDDIPPYTVQLSQCILLLSIVTQASIGLMSSIQAVGKIRNYQITIAIITLINVPLSYVLLKFGLPIYSVAIGFVVIEFIALNVRIIYAKINVGIPPRQFVSNVIYPVLIIIIPSTILCLVPSFIIDDTFVRILTVSIVYGIIYLILIWLVAFDKEERQAITLKIKNRKK